ncbi:hypothetical protein ACRS6B_21815 [Nocardia asteroides]
MARTPLAPGQPYGAAPGQPLEPDANNPGGDSADAAGRPGLGDTQTADCAQPGPDAATVPAPDVPERDTPPRDQEVATTPPAPEPEPVPEVETAPPPPPPPAITLPFGIVIPLPAPPPPPAG